MWHEWSCSMMHCWWPGSGEGSSVSAADLKCGTRGFMPAATHLTLALGPAPSCIMSEEITGDPALAASCQLYALCVPHRMERFLKIHQRAYCDHFAGTSFTWDLALS